MITIRKAAVNDLKIIQSLYKKLRDFEANFTDEFGWEWAYSAKGEKFFKNRLKGYNSIVLIAEEDGKPVGFAQTHIFNNQIARQRGKVAVLEYLYVDEAVRRKRVGAMLLDEIKTILRSKKMPRFKVVAMTDNFNALGFYKKQGFLDFSTILEMDL